VSPALAGRFFTTEPPGKPNQIFISELSRHEKTQGELIILNERSQSEKTTYCMVQTGNYNTMDTRKGSKVPEVKGEEAMNRCSSEDF